MTLEIGRRLGQKEAGNDAEQGHSTAAALAVCSTATHPLALHPLSLPQARASLLGALDPTAAAQEAAAAAGLQQLPGYQPGAPMPMPFPGMTAGGAPPGGPGGA